MHVLSEASDSPALILVACISKLKIDIAYEILRALLTYQNSPYNNQGFSIKFINGMLEIYDEYIPIFCNQTIK